MNMGFVDIHQHLAYGMDDGPKDSQSMFSMLDAAADNGIRMIFATPHAVPGIVRFDFEKYRAVLNEARAYVAYRGWDIVIYEGCEILYTDQTVQMLQDGKIPTLAGTNCVLVEFSPDVSFDKLYAAIERLVCSGYMPVIAHVERYRCLTSSLKNALRLKRDLHVFFQVNCGSVIDSRGYSVRRFLKKMLGMQMIDAVATDAHNTSYRPVNMEKAWTALMDKVGEAYANMLTNGSMIFEKTME